jgi:hypothetical protein
MWRGKASSDWKGSSDVAHFSLLVTPFPPRSHSEMPEIRLWCFFQGRRRPFIIKVDSTELVDELKVKINEKCPLRDFGSAILWKVRYF